jgi:hypothetical protein
MRVLLRPSAWLLVLSAVACSGSAPPPDAPPARASDTPPPRPVSPSPEPASEGEEQEEDAYDDPTQGSHEEAPAPVHAPAHAAKPTQPPSAILTGAKVSFNINYPASAHKRAAEARCEAESGDDYEARAQCMDKARKEFVADVMLFKKEGERGPLSWIIYRRDRGTLFEVSRNQVELTNETEDSVTLKVGKGTGARPLFSGAQQVLVRVPSDSTLEIDDPKLGRIVYEAKIGLVGN